MPLKVELRVPRRWKFSTVELFAGVGGFRKGLSYDGSPWNVVWSNQWEPQFKRQFASDCYKHWFGPTNHSNRDICLETKDLLAGKRNIPRHDLLVAGFPCQDYSVAKPLGLAKGIEGKKGVLWWEIHKILEKRKPRFVLLENVDRLLKSPTSRRGKDFAVILSCFARLNYAVQWRVINAADYGFPQKRRRVFIFAEREPLLSASLTPAEILLSKGVLARAFPVKSLVGECKKFPVGKDPYEITQRFSAHGEDSPFLRAGFMRRGEVWSWNVAEQSERARTLRSIVEGTKAVPKEFYIEDEAVLKKWKDVKKGKSEWREHSSGFKYLYAEGALSFPDDLDKPARTILTAEGGNSPSRFRHVIEHPKGTFRRLTPEELEELNGFPRGWTAGMSDRQRAFCMGNALVVGLVARIGRAMEDEARNSYRRILKMARSANT